MEQEEVLTPKEDVDNQPQVFSNTDLELITLLSQIDSTLVDIIKGVRRVLSDIENPDRFHQAANSIRHLTNILIRNAQDRISAIPGVDLTEEQNLLIDKLAEGFSSILSSIPEGIDGKQSYIDYLEGKFKDLNREIRLGLRGEPITTKQVLKSYFGKDDELASLQEFVQKRIREAIIRWHSYHIYFVKISHYSDDEKIEEDDFISKWEEIQKCALMVLRPFFGTTSVLDEVMKLEEPPNG